MALRRLERLRDALKDLVGAFDARALGPEDATAAVDLLSEIERLAVAARALAADRVVETRAWRGSGAPSAAAWVAARAQTTLGRAASVLETGRAIEALPATKAAFVAGRLSEMQAAEIAAAASVDASAEGALLALAERESVAALRERCRDVRAAAAGDEDACERIRRARYLRHWTDRDGALRLDARLAPDDGAPLLAAVMARADRLAADARRGGRPETPEAYAADALVSLVDGAEAPRAVVHVHVSRDALARGRTVAGETCRIEGVGPVPVGVARAMAAAGSVKLLETDGVAVGRVSHAGRTIPARVRTALEARDPVCAVPGCNRRRGLEIDHVVPLAAGGLTQLANLARLCRWHHAQKTHHGWHLGGSPGAWTWSRDGRAAGRPKRRARAAPARAP